MARVPKKWRLLSSGTPSVSLRGNRYWHEKLGTLSEPLGRASLSPGGEALRLEEFDVELRPEHAYFLDGLLAARSLKRVGARFYLDTHGRLLCALDHVTVFVRDLEEMDILRDIFVQGVYDVRVSGPYVVWDIGMNVGLASLYFASRGAIHVFGYEPIASTFAMAEENMALNPKLRDTISPIHGGIGGFDRTELVDYSPARKGSVGLAGAAGDPVLRRLAFHLPADTEMWKEPMRLDHAADVFARICAAHPDLPVIAKIDCEGAEYEIIEALDESGNLSRLHSVVIEWHRNGPEPLCKRLVNAGFTVFTPGPRVGLWGTVYAVSGGHQSA